MEFAMHGVDLSCHCVQPSATQSASPQLVLEQVDNARILSEGKIWRSSVGNRDLEPVAGAEDGGVYNFVSEDMV